MQSRKSAFIYSSALEQGGYPPECPFNTHRAGMTREIIDSMGLLAAGEEIAPVPLTREELGWFHTSAYLEALQLASKGDLPWMEAWPMGLGTPDCPMFAGMYDYVALAAGGSLTGARLLLGGEADVAFNPSGGFHHAQAGNASGFCYVNDVVVAAMALAEAGKRVVCLDIDVHHCDGVQNAFYKRDDVLTVSLHESGRTLFPGTGFEDEIGKGGGQGYAVNLPFPVGTYDDAYLRAFYGVAEPIIRQYDPDVIVLELGMDALSGDPLAHLQLTNNVHAEITRWAYALGKPLLATGGGGYHIDNTVRGWALCWSVLRGEPQEQMVGSGGVMLENADWASGLRDRVLLTDGGRRGSVDREVDNLIRRQRARLFPLHGL